MKKVIKLTESELVSIIKKIIKEQQEFGESNPSKCLKAHISFMFEKSVMVNGMVEDGGDLALWNKSNQIPDPSDKNAYNRFVKLLKEYVDGNYFGFEECEGVTFEEIKPLIKDMYLAEIEKHSEFTDGMPSSLKRRLFQFEEKLKDIIDRTDVNEFSDEFEYADNVISWALMESGLENDADELMDIFKDMFGDMLFDVYHSNVDDYDSM